MFREVDHRTQTSVDYQLFDNSLRRDRPQDQVFINHIVPSVVLWIPSIPEDVVSQTNRIDGVGQSLPQKIGGTTPQCHNRLLLVSILPPFLTPPSLNYHIRK